MNQSIDISIPKLSAPVEALKINPRACHGLRRASIYTVAEILLAGKPKVNSARHIGPITTNRIFAALASYLGLTEDQLAGEDSWESENLFTHAPEVWQAPISTLPLPALTLHALTNMGLRRIHELVKFRASGYSKILGLGAGDILTLDQELRWYLARAAQVQLLPIVGTDGIFDSLTPELRTKRDLGSILASPGLDERAWSILELRAMHFVSLEAIGAQIGGLSKPAVFQIMRQAHNHLRHRLDFLSVFFDHFEEKSRVLLKSLGSEPLELKTLVSHLNPDPARSSLIANEKEVEQAILLLRTLVIHPTRWFSEQVEPRWPALLLLSSLVEPTLARYAPVRQILRKRSKIRKL